MNDGFWVDCTIRTIATQSKPQWNQDKTAHSLKTNMTKHIWRFDHKHCGRFFSLFHFAKQKRGISWHVGGTAANRTEMLVTFIWNPVPLRNEVNSSRKREAAEEENLFSIEMLNKLTFSFFGMIKSSRASSTATSSVFSTLFAHSRQSIALFSDWEFVTFIYLIPLFILLIYSILSSRRWIQPHWIEEKGSHTKTIASIISLFNFNWIFIIELVITFYHSIAHNTNAATTASKTLWKMTCLEIMTINLFGGFPHRFLPPYLQTKTFWAQIIFENINQKAESSAQFNRNDENGLMNYVLNGKSYVIISIQKLML